MSASASVTQGNSTTLFRCEIQQEQLQLQQSADAATNNNSNPHTIALQLLKSVQDKTSDFLNDLVKQQQQQQQTQDGAGGNRRGRGLNEVAEDDESDSDDDDLLLDDEEEFSDEEELTEEAAKNKAEKKKKRESKRAAKLAAEEKEKQKSSSTTPSSAAAAEPVQKPSSSENPTETTTATTATTTTKPAKEKREKAKLLPPLSRSAANVMQIDVREPITVLPFNDPSAVNHRTKFGPSIPNRFISEVEIAWNKKTATTTTSSTSPAAAAAAAASTTSTTAVVPFERDAGDVKTAIEKFKQIDAKHQWVCRDCDTQNTRLTDVCRTCGKDRFFVDGKVLVREKIRAVTHRSKEAVDLRKRMHAKLRQNCQKQLEEMNETESGPSSLL